MVQLFISHSTAFCFHANGSEDFNGARITPLVGAPSDLCFVLAASHLQLRGEWNLVHLCLGEKDGTEPLNVNHIDCNRCPPVPSRSCSRAARRCRGMLRCGRLGHGSQEGAGSGAGPVCAAGGSACPQARPRRSWPARGQAKQRKVRVSGTELCPRLRKHILAEERNTMQAGRETQLPSNPLQEALGSLQLLESYYQLLGSLLLQAFVCLFSVFCTSVLQRGKNGVRREGRARAGGQAARLPFPARHYLIVWPWGMSPCHFPLCPGSSVPWAGSTQTSTLCLFTRLCPCKMPWRSLGGSSAWPGRAQTHRPGELQPTQKRWGHRPPLLAHTSSSLLIEALSSMDSAHPALSSQQQGGQMEIPLPEGWEVRSVTPSRLDRVFPTEHHMWCAETATYREQRARQGLQEQKSPKHM